jgi:hypothetical protein
MSSTCTDVALSTFRPMLETLSTLLDKGAEHGGDTRRGPAALVDGRLAPDMYPLAMQVELACHHALDTTARLAGRMPSPPGEPASTLDGLKARIADTLGILGEIPVAELASADERTITMDLGPDLVLEAKGAVFLRDWGLPHFYFHVVTAYDILRHNGVMLGKQDYLRHVGRLIRPRGAVTG